MRKFLKIKKFFRKICIKFQSLTPRTKKFPAAAAENKKFPAAAEGRKKLKIFSRRRRERRRLTPLPAPYKYNSSFIAFSILDILNYFGTLSLIYYN
jgi:hypothetical protein